MLEVNHGRVVMFGSELLFLMYKIMLFFGMFLHEAAHTAAKSRTNLSTASGPIGPEVAPASVFHGHNFIKTLQIATIAGSSPEISQTVRMNCRSFLSRVRISLRPRNLF